TEHLLGLSHGWHPRRVDVGRVNGRHFLFSSGVGLDASVVARVDAHPRLKARGGQWYYAAAAIATFTRRYLVSPPRLRVALGDEPVAGVTAIVQCSDPYTYFGDRPVRMGEGATLHSGDLAGVVLERANPLDLATVSWRMLSSRAQLGRHRHVHPFSAVRDLTVISADERPLALQVDGDHIGDVREAAYASVPSALLVLS
ncbi:MAG: diacylglycerol/lipid kinase family protein, partial [Solirubrobacteraceae bacterium]